MKRGFTLLELMVVIIILGVLATLGVMQYQSAIERSRGAEARQIIGQLRTECAAIFMRDNSTANCIPANMSIGASIPGPLQTDCGATHYFTYNSAPVGVTGADVIFTAARCDGSGSPGKNPDFAGGNLTLTTDYGLGQDDWASAFGY